MRETLKKLLDDESLKLIILPEKFIKVTSEIRMEVLKKKTYPLFIIVPGLKGEAKGARLRELKTLISFAAGIKLNDYRAINRRKKS